MTGPTPAERIEQLRAANAELLAELRSEQADLADLQRRVAAITPLSRHLLVTAVARLTGWDAAVQRRLAAVHVRPAVVESVGKQPADLLAAAAAADAATAAGFTTPPRRAAALSRYRSATGTITGASIAGLRAARRRLRRDR